MASRVTLEYRRTAFERRLLTFAIINHEHIDIREFLSDAFHYFESELKKLIETHTILKVNTCFSATFEKVIQTNEGEKSEKQTTHIHTKNEIIDIDTDLSQFFEDIVIEYILKKVDDVMLEGSGFTLSSINELAVQVNQYNPISGSSYLPVPTFLASKHAIVNVRNFDEQCFRWAVLSALYPCQRNAARVEKYFSYKDELNFTGIHFPMKVRDITKFEQLNNTISINVYHFDKKAKVVCPLRLTKNVKNNHIHLLLLTKDNNDNNNTADITEHHSHYCWIKSLSRLIRSQLTKHCAKLFFCDRCLNNFTNVNTLEKHRIVCMVQNECKIDMPSENDNIIKFKNFRYQLESPFVIYADTEALLKKPEESFCNSDSTIALQKHEVYSVGYYFKCSYDDSKSYYRAKRGLDCIDWFVDELRDISYRVSAIFCNIKPMQITQKEEIEFQKAEKCHICDEKFNNTDIKHRDHSHLTGKYRSASHASCNLQYQESRIIPVVFHNLSNYDAHFLIKKLATGLQGGISVIPTNAENYISFTKTVEKSSSDYKKMIKFKFIDSFRFLASSLSHLSSLLPSEKKRILNLEYRDLSNEQRKLLERKGVFCYDYVDSWEKLEELSLPTKDKFYSSLIDEEISEDEYKFAMNVWNSFEVKTLGDYSDLYLKTDVLLLADVFENFRQTCLNIYKLDGVHYFTAPGFSFDSMLRYTKVEIELLTDIDMHMFIERGIRGGISQCSKRYAEANNKYMPNYKPDEETKYLIYIDCNNLYGYSMMQYLPISDFAWSKDQFNVDNILAIPDDCDVGYIFEVDLDYPPDLHDYHNDYPFCAANQNVPDKRNVKKLLLTLEDKKNYVIHYRMLKLAITHGLILKKVHRVLQFKQSPWLKPYIDLNTEMRTKATNDFEKNFFKLLINAIFGKTMENLRSRVDIRLRTKWSGTYGARKLIANPNFKRHIIFDEDLVAIEMQKTQLLMNKPIAIGMAILDISKCVMYQFHYEHIKLKYGDKAQMIYTDTDSFIYEVNTDCFYSDMKLNLEKYDTSDYPSDNIFEMPRVNKKVPGLFKDELNSLIMTAFVGLRSKMYCVQAGNVDKMKKAKGVKKYVLKKEICFDDYVNCLMNSCTISKAQNSFRSKLHSLYTIRQSKIALSPFDDKRYICPNNIDTLAWGHYRIRTEN